MSIKNIFKDLLQDVSPEDLEKSLVRRYRDPHYYAVSKDGSNMLDFGWGGMPTDNVTEDATHPMNGKHYVVSENQKYQKQLHQPENDDEATEMGAHSKALSMVENSKNNISVAHVCKGCGKSFAGRHILESTHSYEYIHKSKITESDKPVNDIFSVIEDIEKATSVQSIIFPKDKYTVEEARKWLKSHGKHSGKVDTTDQYHRFRQFDPSECSTTPKTISLGGSGIKAIICTKGVSKAETQVAVTRITKVAAFQQGIVYGIVYEPDTVDTHGDYTSAEEIEKAAHEFLPSALKNGTNGFTDINHAESVPENSVEIIESYIAPVDFAFDNGQQVKKGSWVVGMRVLSDALKSAIESNQITGFSLEGTAYKIGD